MNLLRFDIQQSKLIPFVAISILLTYMTVSFFELEMFLASYVALVGMFLAFLISLLLVIREKTIHQFDFTVFAFVFILEGISFLNGTDWKNWLYATLCISTYILLFNYYQEKYHVIILGILFTLSIATYCQLYQCLTHPELWAIEDTKELHGYLMGGNYNGIGIRLIIALTVGILSAKYGKLYQLNLVLLIISSFAILFMVRSMTSLSCLILFLIFCFIRNRRLLTLANVGIYFAVFFFQTFVCFSGKGIENNELASWFVVDILGKDLTFTGRTELWDAALRVINDSPIWGYGFVDGDWFRANMSNIAIGAHNYILNTMVYGGIIAISLYFILIFESFQNLIRINDLNAQRLISFFGVANIMMLFEAYPTPLVFLLLALMYYYPGQYASHVNKNPVDSKYICTNKE